MRKHKQRRVLALVLTFVVLLCVSGLHAFAATVTQDGLEVTLVTDKAEYSANEQIKTTLTVKNNNDTAVENVDLETAIPEGYILADKSENKKTVESVAAGESVSLEVTLTKKATPDEPSTDPKSSTNPVSGGNSSGSGTTTSGTTSGSAVQTGRGLLAFGIVLLVLLTSGATFVFLYRKNQNINKSSKGLLSVILCFGIACSSVVFISVRSNALEDKKSIDVSSSIMVDGKAFEVKSTVKYSGYIFHESAKLSDFTSDEEYFSCDTESKALFTVKVEGNVDEIRLIEDGNQFVGLMLDDGTSGDRIASDGIYSYQLIGNVKSDELLKKEYYAETNDVKSNSQEIYFFPRLDENTSTLARDNFNEVNNTLQKFDSQYLNENGSVPESQKQTLLSEISKALDVYVDNGIILKYATEKNCIYIKLTSGLTLMYEPTEQKVSSSGTNVTVDFVSYQPNPDIEDENISSNMDEYAHDYNTTSHNYQGTDVTLELIKKLPSNSLIYWHGHGGFGPIVKSYLSSGEYFDWAQWWLNGYYFIDCVQDRIICRSTEEQNELAAFTSKFITDYCGDLSNDCIILGSCHSMQETNLADALLWKNAEAVLGFTETVYTAYEEWISFKCINYLTQINTETNNYYTLREALGRSISEVGANDIEYARNHPETFNDIKSSVAEPRIWEGSAADNYRLQNLSGILSGKICKSLDRLTAIPNATITVYKDGLAYITKKSDANGNYSINLPNGQFYVEIKASGYSDFHSNVNIAWGATTSLNVFLENAKGLVKGKITNSLTNAGVEGVTLTIRNGWNNTDDSAETVATSTTNSNGNYSVELSLGKYTVIASKNEYETSSFNITANTGTTDNQNGTITPIASPSGYTALELWPMNDSAIFGLLKDKNINISTMEYAGTTYALVSGSELPGFYLAIQNGSNVTKDNYKNAPIAFIFMTEPAVFSSKQDSTYGNVAIGMSFNDLPTKFTQNMSKLSDGVYMVSLFNGSSMARLQFNSSNKLESMRITRHMY